MVATYLAPNQFRVSGGNEALFPAGRRLRCSCGNDGVFKVTVERAVYQAPNTVVTVKQGVLTPNLNSIRFGISDSIPDHRHDPEADGTGGGLSQFVQKSAQATITVAHEFNPNQPGAPFTLGVNARGRLVPGLNAERIGGKTLDEIQIPPPPALEHLSVTFSIIDLDAGKLVIEHGFNKWWVHVDVFDDQNERVTPDEVKPLDLHFVELDFTSFVARGLFAGTWHVDVY